MFRLLYPYEYVDSVFSIDYNKLYRKGYRGILLDIDNTLVPHGKDSTKEVDELFQRIHNAGLQTLILSNNNEARVRRFLTNIDSLYICDAQKPKPANYRRALDMMGIPREQAVCIGDQIFTDIFGANLCHIATILVQYIRAKNETKIGKRRTLEKVILGFYAKSRSCQNRIGDIFSKGGDAEDAGEQTQAVL